MYALCMLLYELDQNRTDIYFRDKEVLYLIKLLILGDKRFELLKAIAIEFTAQPFLPIKEPSFIQALARKKKDIFFSCLRLYYIYLWLILINPGQLPLPEPYFDLTLIRATHTKIPNKRIYKTYLFFLLVTKKANLLRMPLSACDEWLVPIQGLFTVTW